MLPFLLPSPDSRRGAGFRFVSDQWWCRRTRWVGLARHPLVLWFVSGYGVLQITLLRTCTCIHVHLCSLYAIMLLLTNIISMLNEFRHRMPVWYYYRWKSSAIRGPGWMNTRLLFLYGRSEYNHGPGSTQSYQSPGCQSKSRISYQGTDSKSTSILSKAAMFVEFRIYARTSSCSSARRYSALRTTGS